MSLYNPKIKALAASLATYSSLPLLTDNVENNTCSDIKARVRVSVDNPLCGDRIELSADYQCGQINALYASVRGCLPCQAAAAIALSAVKQSPIAVDEVAVVSRQWHAFLQLEQQLDWQQVCQQAAITNVAWYQLALLTPLRNYKSRQACVRLIFDGLQKVFQQAQ